MTNYSITAVLLIVTGHVIAGITYGNGQLELTENGELESKLYIEISRIRNKFFSEMANMRKELEEVKSELSIMEKRQLEMEATIDGLEIAIENLESCQNQSSQTDDETSNYRNERKYNQTNDGPDCSLDILFVLDGSGSVGNANFTKVKNWVKNFTSGFGMDSSNVSVGVIQYSHKFSRRKIKDQPYIKTYIKIGEFQNHTTFSEEVDKIELQGFTTYTGAALRKAMIDFRNSTNFNDTNARQAMILVTDGISSDWRAVEINSKRLRNIGVTSFVIGIGDAYLPELQVIANGNEGDSNRVHMLNDFSNLANVSHQLLEEIKLLAEECKTDKVVAMQTEIEKYNNPVEVSTTYTPQTTVEIEGQTMAHYRDPLQNKVTEKSKNQSTNLDLESSDSQTTEFDNSETSKPTPSYLVYPTSSINTDSAKLDFKEKSKQDPSAKNSRNVTRLNNLPPKAELENPYKDDSCDGKGGKIYQGSCYWLTISEHATLSYMDAKEKCTDYRESKLADVHSNDVYNAIVEYVLLEARQRGMDHVTAWTDMTRAGKDHIRLSNGREVNLKGQRMLNRQSAYDGYSEEHVYVAVWDKPQSEMIENGLGFAESKLGMNAALCVTDK